VEFEDKDNPEELGAESGDSDWDQAEAPDSDVVDDSDPFPDDIFGTPPALDKEELVESEPEYTEEIVQQEPEPVAAANSPDDEIAVAATASMSGGTPTGENGMVLTRRGHETRPVSYDFRRPIQLSKGFSRSLTIVSETFAKLLTLSLSNYLRIPVSVTAKGVRQVLFEEHTKSINNPSCINILDLAPIKIPGMMNIDINLIFAMIEKLLGSRELHDDVCREFTSIEARIARKVVLRMLTDLREAMLRVLEVDVGLTAIEHNPDFTYIMNANDACILLHFEVELGEFTGQMSICISLAGLDAEAGSEGNSPYRDVRSDNERLEDADRLSLVLGSTGTEIVAEVGRVKVNYDEIKDLEVGSVLSLRKHLDEPVKVMVGGCPLFHGKMGRFKSKSAVRLTRVLRPKDKPLGGVGKRNSQGRGSK
jgi:flagellar motor switch protein FliM